MKRSRTLSLLIGPLVVALMLANMLEGFSSVMAAKQSSAPSINTGQVASAPSGRDASDNAASDFVMQPGSDSFASAAAPTQTLLTIYCGISSSNPNFRQLSVVANDLGVGFPTMNYTLYGLDMVTLVDPQPASTAEKN